MAVIRTAAVFFGSITLIAACSPTTETPSTATQTPSATTSASTPQSGPLRGPEPSAATPLLSRSLVGASMITGSSWTAPRHGVTPVYGSASDRRQPRHRVSSRSMSAASSSGDSANSRR